MECEMCGEGDVSTRKMLVEGVQMYVCGKCSRYAKELPTRGRSSSGKYDQQPKSRNSRGRAKKNTNYQFSGKKKGELIVKKNYAEILKKARQESGLTKANFAKKLNIAQNLYKRMESGKLKPQIQDAQKIEHQIKYKLTRIAVDEDIEYQVPKSQMGNRTLADMIKRD